MRHRFSKVVLGLALFALLAGTSTVAARSHHAAASSYNVGFIYPRTGLLGDVRGRGDRGLQARAPVRDERDRQGQRQDDQRHVRGRQGRSRHRRRRGEGPDRPGLQDPRWARGSSGVALQIAPLAAQNQILYISGPAAYDGDHRHQQVHVPGRPSDLSGRARRRLVPRQDDRQEGRGLRPGLRVRPRQLRRGQGGSRRQGSQRQRDLGPADARPTSRRSRSRPSRRTPTCSSSRGPARRPGRCGRRSTSRASSPARRSSPGLAERATWASLGTRATKIQFLSHYVWTGAEEQGQRLARATQMRKRGRQVPDLFTPDGFVSGADARPRAAEGRLRRRQDDLGARGLEVPGAEGLPGDPAAGSRDAAADVPRAAGVEERQARRQGLGTASPYDTAPPIYPFPG